METSTPEEERHPYPIDVTEVGLLNIEMKHTDQGSYSADKSVFNVPAGMPFRAFVERLVRMADRMGWARTRVRA